jgi:ribosomal-protein-alanine N-acetyltransferase
MAARRHPALDRGAPTAQPALKARVRLTRPSARDTAEFLAAARASRKLHGRWVTAPTSASKYREFLRRARRRAQASYLLRLRSSGELVGVVNVSEIVRGAFQSAYLGYYAFSPHDGQGLMAEGIRLVMRDAFGRLGLHRLEAGVQPGNKASLRLVRSLGFRREGYSPRYLKIAGRWRDHERWAITADE